MKKVLYSLVLIVILLPVTGFSANNNFLPANGNFSDPANWSLGHMPQDNETVKVPAAAVCSVDIVTDVFDTTTFRIFGKLYFICGQKIRLACSSRLIIQEGGSMEGECTGSKLQYCGSYVWDGGDGIVTGLAFYPNSGGSGGSVDDFFTEHQTSAHRVNWSSSDGADAVQYIVERSEDGVSFYQIGTVMGAGPGSSGHDYEYLDYDIEGLSSLNSVFYRISWKDENGNEENGPVMTVRIQAPKEGPKVFPNPVKSPVGFLTIELPEQYAHSFFTISIYDATGRLAGQIQVSGWDGSNRIDISADIASMGLKPSTYFMSFPDGTRLTLVVN